MTDDLSPPSTSLPGGLADHPETYHRPQRVRAGEHVVIYSASRKVDDAPVLLKTPRSDRPTELELARFAHELAVLSRLVGAPVAHAVEMVVRRGRPWLVLEDLGGMPLNRIAGRFRVPARAVALCAKVAAALSEVHLRGVVHRDLKPHHVLVLDDGSVRLTDFRYASLVRFDSAATPIHGSLAYMAPEQSGRMNRSVDKRADLYSLGVTLYELLTGRLPFDANDSLEWIHAHIAKIPLAPSELDERVPASAEAIVLKLLSKHAEDRYHGATGLQRDLERCASKLALDDTAQFELGTEDVPGHFQVAHQFYGRELEVARLVAGFDRAQHSESCVVTLIGGYSGVGKSSLVTELFQPIVRERGRFLCGKFDQYKRDIPYATVVQAFRDLLKGLLAVGEAALDSWRERILEALGGNGRLIVDVVPELGLIVGPQPSVRDLDPREGQNRFELVFSAFVRVFARPDQPLVLFLDDMQWADGATLGLLKILARPGQVPHLQLVLAFRSNEVDARHPFQCAVDAMRADGARVEASSVLELGPEHVLKLVADTVSRLPSEAAPLATMIGKKAGGNPFFIGELLHVLHARGLLTFDAAVRGWTWDEVAIRGIDVADNVVDLLIDRVRNLPDETRRALTVASCFGSSFDSSTLATVLDLPLESVSTALYLALGDGFIVPVDDSLGVAGLLRFQHDRIQQAADSLVGDERAAIHLRIGRVLRNRFLGGLDAVLFDAVMHLDQGARLIVDEGERQTLIELNLLAGKRAKGAIAWEPARLYLESAASLLGDDAWEASYATTFAVHRELAECEFLASKFTRAETRYDELRRLSRSKAERGEVANSQVKLYIVMGRYDEALRLGLAELEHFGEPLVRPDQDLTDALVIERGRLAQRLTGLDLRSIVDLPVLTDPEPRALIVLLTSIAPAIYSRRPALFPMLAMRTVNLSLEHGNCEHSCFGYSLYAMLLASADGDTKRAFELSEASIALNERFEDPKLRGTVLHIHANHIAFWRRPYAEVSSLQEGAYLAAMNVGDLTIAAYVSFMGGWQCLARGQTLTGAEAAIERFEALARRTHHVAAQLTVAVQRQYLRALAGLTEGPLSLSDSQFDADDARSRITHAGFDTGLVMHDLLRAMLAWHHGDYPAAEAWLSRGAPSLPAAFALPLETTWALFDALTASALWETARAETRGALLARVERAEAQFRAWAQGCPENFGAEHAVVASELARLQGRIPDALYGYERAVDSARRSGLLHVEILATNVAVRLARSESLARSTRRWLGDAHDVFAQWGAAALRSTFEASNPDSRGSASSPSANTVFEAKDFDFLSAIKGSQALSRETTIEGVTQALLRVVLEYAGARRAVVSLMHDGQLRPSRAASVDGDTSSAVAESVVRYVERTSLPLVLADALADTTFAGDHT